MIEHASLKQDDVALDIGAGLGFLTKILSEKCGFIVAVESDERLAEALRFRFRDSPSVKVVEGNILTVSLPAFNKVVSIPPYGISSRLLLWLFHRSFACAVLVFQREFANRLVADVGGEDYGWLSVLTTYYLDVELSEDVARSAFFPPPEVDSVIVNLKPWQFRPFEVRDESVFERMVRFLFTQRNKKLKNVLSSFAKSGSPANMRNVNNLLESASFADRRVRDLAPNDLGVLADAYCQ
jgi:16S rRNA (adenine1518-N6/adenine1519-N6)-dimethyltransferase